MLFAGLLLSVLLVSSQTSLGSRANQVTWLPGAETVTFQNGTSNYTGTRDSFIAQSTPNKNYAGNAKIQVKSDTSMVSLLSFSLPEIPDDVTVTKATLSVTALGAAANSVEQVQAYSLLQDWQENRVTWKRRMRQDDSDILWQAPGASQPGADSGATPVGRLEKMIDTTYSVDVTSVVHSWIENPASNYGILLKSSQNSGTAQYSFASSEHSNKRIRPLLSIEYTLPETQPSPSPVPSASPEPTTPPTSDGRNWNTVESWAYQLSGYQNNQLNQIKNAAFDVVVIDLARDGYTDYFTNSEITAVKNSGKFALAYFEIGAIENYRPEWGDTPSSVKACSVEGWPDEKYTKFWHPDWWTIVKSRIDRALIAGFDGAYLDMVVTYEELATYCDPSDYDQKSQDELAADMILLIEKVARYARTESQYSNPAFKVLPQNAPELYTWDFSGTPFQNQNLNQRYISAIDGIGMEELFFMTTDRPCTQSWCVENRNNAHAIRQQNKVVLTVDYANNSGNITSAYSQSRSYGFVPYASVVSLDILRSNE